MNKYVKNNAEWVRLYDNTVEIEKVEELVKKLNISKLQNLNIIDVGCGNGRSTKWLHEMFPNSRITAIDISQENIMYAKKKNELRNVHYIQADAFDFFSAPLVKEQYDLVFFCWSLFDMVSNYEQSEKTGKLTELITSVKKKLNVNGHIVVLQPTKGGDFEKLLSKFMPGSDDDYLLTHNFLKNSHFQGAETPFPEKNTTDAIWSKFFCNRDQLYQGVTAIIMLETGENLDRVEFDNKFDKFLLEHELWKDGCYSLSDCVNLYYVSKGV